MNRTHGKAKTSIYNIWLTMRARCANPNCVAFKDYGARGITVSPEWMSFEKFYADMGDRPPGLTLDRVDNDKGYSVDNCKWSARVEQGRNKRNNVLLTIDGETRSLREWAERYGLNYATVHQRIRKYGWSPEDAVKVPLVTTRKGVPKGEKIHAFGAKHGVEWSEPQQDNRKGSAA